MSGQRQTWLMAAAGVLAVLILVGLLELWLQSGPSAPIFSEAWLHDLATRSGALGPLVLVALMVLAIVCSPIPSGPIAMAAGAIYGSTGGAVISIAGAQAGAMLAFCLARYMAYGAVQRSQNPVLRFMAKPRSETALMGIVFASRLVPFISFDAVSYAAGVTNLGLWRFALATLVGVVPICWTLAAMGAGMATGGLSWPLVVLLGGGITLIPAGIALLRARLRKSPPQ